MEQVIVGQFTEIKRHKPSVIFIPNIETWYASLRDSLAMITFQTMLRAIPPTDPVLLLATSESEVEDLPRELLKDLFGYSRKNRIEIERPEQVSSIMPSAIGVVKGNAKARHANSRLAKPTRILLCHYQLCQDEP